MCMMGSWEMIVFAAEGRLTVFQFLPVCMMGGLVWGGGGVTDSSHWFFKVDISCGHSLWSGGMVRTNWRGHYIFSGHLTRWFYPRRCIITESTSKKSAAGSVRTGLDLWRSEVNLHILKLWAVDIIISLFCHEIKIYIVPLHYFLYVALKGCSDPR